VTQTDVEEWEKVADQANVMLQLQQTLANQAAPVQQPTSPSSAPLPSAQPPPV
jgi:hypothetical protein